MSRCFLLLFATVVISQTAFSQVVYNNDRFHTLELGLGIGTDKSVGSYINEYGELVEDGNGVYRARFISGAYVHPNITVGFGGGLDWNYGNLRKCTTPVFLDVRFFAKEREDRWDTMFLYFDYGRNINWGKSFLAGDFFECGIGYSYVSIGYSSRSLRIAGEPTRFHSIVGSIVLLFP